MTLVAGVDSSTQSTKVVVVDAATGDVRRSASSPHPEGTEVDPEAWWQALRQAVSGGLLDGVEALAVAGQQHGLVALDAEGAVVRAALLWNDVRSASQSEELVAELGGPAAWAARTGSVPVPSYTVTKLRWLRDEEPELAQRVGAVMLPHDWLTWRLAGEPRGAAVTDRGDASGTGYWSLAEGVWLPDLVERALGHRPELPLVAEPAALFGPARGLAASDTASSGTATSGTASSSTASLSRASLSTASRARLAAGTGDNMAAALGLGASPGDAIVSVGTSGVASAVSESPTADATGAVCGFADATGRYLPLVCTLNAARVLTTIAGLLGVTPEAFDRLALSAPAGAGGLTLLPFLDGERTPSLPHARGLLAGLSRANATPATVARAAVEGVLCSLAAGLDALRGQGVAIRRVLLVGGGARSRAVQLLAPDLLGVPVFLPDVSTEWVALGAARQAAWALGGESEPPVWVKPVTEIGAPGGPGGRSGAEIRSAYEGVLGGTRSLLDREIPGGLR